MTEISPINVRPSNASETFNFVNQRFLGQVFTQNQWIRLIDDFIRVTKAGGWIELMESNHMINNPGPITKNNAVQQHLISNGMNPKMYLQIPKLMANTNKFVSIKSLETITPLGDWQQTSQGMKTLELLAESLKSL
ncbi:10389_t:CDS:2 [Ambispora gerdemannii]|uniref:10389_t:CDS:1 n=1 Tax=Ambispora gerdemannii TaxID=144530 RepID=A0A9N8ZDC6_9GLOM|nr:10389_t:CDS:2 [Ambispora gerdemannii]